MSPSRKRAPEAKISTREERQLEIRDVASEAVELFGRLGGLLDQERVVVPKYVDEAISWLAHVAARGGVEPTRQGRPTGRTPDRSVEGDQHLPGLDGAMTEEPTSPGQLF